MHLIFLNIPWVKNVCTKMMVMMRCLVSVAIIQMLDQRTRAVSNTLHIVLHPITTILVGNVYFTKTPQIRNLAVDQLIKQPFVNQYLLLVASAKCTQYRLAILLSLRLSWFCWKVYLLGGGVFVPVFVMRSLKIWIAVFLYQNERGDKDFTPDLDLFTKKQIEITRRKKIDRNFARVQIWIYSCFIFILSNVF